MTETMGSRVMMVRDEQLREKDRNKRNSQMIYLIPECWLTRTCLLLASAVLGQPHTMLNTDILLLGVETVKGDHQLKIERGSI